MSISGIQGQVLEVTVVACDKLKNTEWISRQDPYVCVEYGSTKHRTRTCTDGGKKPMFQEKFVFTLIEGLREFNIVVWNSNTLTFDDFIGNGRVQLQKVLSQGYDDSPYPLQDKRGKYAGEVRLIMHYANANANKPGKTNAPSAPLASSAPPYTGTPQPQAPLYSAPPSAAHYPPTTYPPQPQTHYPSFTPNAPTYPPPPPYHQPAAAYPPAYPPTPSYPPNPSYHYPPAAPYPSSLYPPPPY
ncbi:hypothetical protein CASFOL_042316 [Castilleja foliolosa]|uniref:C2 domain-containing protein n=1 Tax=Castilleja foliolosa TaxID=1961234 RepID=A0ABD3BAF1_9LAMI